MANTDNYESRYLDSGSCVGSITWLFNEPSPDFRYRSKGRACHL